MFPSLHKPVLGVPIPPNRDNERQAATRDFVSKLARTEIINVNSGARNQFRGSAEAPVPPPGAGPDWRPPVLFLPSQRFHATAEGADHEKRVAVKKIRNLK